jgi:hypothetical protein
MVTIAADDEVVDEASIALLHELVVDHAELVELLGLNVEAQL